MIVVALYNQVKVVKQPQLFFHAVKTLLMSSSPPFFNFIMLFKNSQSRSKACPEQD